MGLAQGIGMTFLTAALAGLVGSPHCVGMCGPFAAAQQRTDAVFWHLGRWMTYALLGALAAGVGFHLPTPLTVGASLALLLWTTLRLAGWAPSIGFASGLHRRLGRSLGRLGPLGMGAACGFLPCGLVAAAVAVAATAGGAARGALTMLAFGLGTTPLLALVQAGLGRLVIKTTAARRVLAVGVLVLGVGVIAYRAQPTANGVPPCHAGALAMP